MKLVRIFKQNHKLLMNRNVCSTNAAGEVYDQIKENIK